MSIENPTLAHFRHFSSLFTNLPSTSVESALQISPFMQNKPNVKDAQISVNSYMTSIYTKLDIWLFGKNKAKQTQLKPKQSQFKPNCFKGQKMMQSMYIQRIMKKIAAMGYKKQTQFKPKTNPVLSAVEWANFKGKSCCRVCHKPLLLRVNLSDTNVKFFKHKAQN